MDARSGQGARWYVSCTCQVDADHLAEAKERETRTAQRNGAEQSTTTLQNGSERDMEFSLVTGAYRTPKTFGNGDGAAELLVEGIQAMAVRNKEFSLAKLESAGSESALSGGI